MGCVALVLDPVHIGISVAFSGEHIIYKRPLLL